MYLDLEVVEEFPFCSDCSKTCPSKAAYLTHRGYYHDELKSALKSINGKVKTLLPVKHLKFFFSVNFEHHALGLRQNQGLKLSVLEMRPCRFWPQGARPSFRTGQGCYSNIVPKYITSLSNLGPLLWNLGARLFLRRQEKGLLYGILPSHLLFQGGFARPLGLESRCNDSLLWDGPWKRFLQGNTSKSLTQLGLLNWSNFFLFCAFDLQWLKTLQPYKIKRTRDVTKCSL